MHNTMEKSAMHYALWKKPDLKCHMLCHSAYTTKYRERKQIRGRGRGGGGAGVRRQEEGAGETFLGPDYSLWWLLHCVCQNSTESYTKMGGSHSI